MQEFQFELQSVLQLRRHQCELRRQSLAAVLQHEQELLDQQARVESERREQIDALRRIATAVELDVNASRSRRSFVDRLAVDLEDIAFEHSLVSDQIATCHQALLRARQAVESLEKLAEKRKAAFMVSQERTEAREQETAWQAQRAMELARSRS